MPAASTLIDGRYRLDDQLGSGGAAEVWAATDVETGERVAVKTLHARCHDDDARRLQREAHILERLTHPGIARLRDAGVVDHQPYLVLDLIEGRTLGDVLADAGPLRPETVSKLAGELGDALAYAHDQGVIHRDVKPGNVMIDGDGRSCLVDFGVGRLAGITATVTHIGSVTGTLAYLSPEQSAGSRVTAASDVYSFGLVLAEAATGRRVFDGTPSEITATRLAGDAPIPADAPASLAPLLRSMTLLDPRERPTARLVAATASSMAETTAQPVAVPVAADEPTQPVTPPPDTDQLAPAVVPSPSLADAARPAPGAAAVAGAARWLRGTFEREREVLPDDDRGGRVDMATSRVLLAGAAAIGLLMMIGALAASGDGGPADASTSASTTVVAPSTTSPPTTAPADEKDEEKDEEGGKGNGKGNGKGKDGDDD